MHCPGLTAVDDQPAVEPHEVEDGDVYQIKGKPDRICKSCRRTIQRRYERRYENRVRETKSHSMRRHRLRIYGITVEEYDALVVASGGRCAICKAETKLDIDHDHATGVVRGLLCGRCNKALGLFGDDVEVLRAAIAYLSR